MAKVDRSIDFYQRWLGFSTAQRSFPDGTVFVRDAEGTDLAFHEGLPGAGHSSVHFGFRWSEAAAVRRLREDLMGSDVEVIEFDDESAIVSVKFHDPDGYEVEVYWESD